MHLWARVYEFAGWLLDEHFRADFEDYGLLKELRDVIGRRDARGTLEVESPHRVKNLIEGFGKVHRALQDNWTRQLREELLKDKVYDPSDDATVSYRDWELDPEIEEFAFHIPDHPMDQLGRRLNDTLQCVGDLLVTATTTFNWDEWEARHRSLCQSVDRVREARNAIRHTQPISQYLIEKACGSSHQEEYAGPKPSGPAVASENSVSTPGPTDRTAVAGVGKDDDQRRPLTAKQANILEALVDQTLRAPELSEKAGYPNNSGFRNELSNMRKLGLLEKTDRGYRRGPKAPPISAA